MINKKQLETQSYTKRKQNKIIFKITKLNRLNQILIITRIKYQ